MIIWKVQKFKILIMKIYQFRMRESSISKRKTIQVEFKSLIIQHQGSIR